jgi:homocysteine S-methyltransferase
VERIAATWRKTTHLGIPIILGMIPLVSYRNAEFLNAEFPGIDIPEQVRRRMNIGDKTAEREEGLRIAAETLAAVKGFVPGFYIIPPFNRFDLVLELKQRVEALPAGPVPEGIKPLAQGTSVGAI